jgi:hypothetical protein
MKKLGYFIIGLVISLKGWAVLDRTEQLENDKSSILRSMAHGEEAGFQKYSQYLRAYDYDQEDCFGEGADSRRQRIEQEAPFHPSIMALYLEGLRFGKYGFKQDEDRATMETQRLIALGHIEAMFHDLFFTQRDPKEALAMAFKYAERSKDEGMIDFLLLNVRVHLQKCPGILKGFLPLEDKLCSLGSKAEDFYKSLTPLEIARIQ